MKIGDRIFVRGYIDEIRKDTVIVRNDGGYFGTTPSEVTPSAQPEITLESSIDYLHSIGWMQKHDKEMTDSAYTEGYTQAEAKYRALWDEMQANIKEKAFGKRKGLIHTADIDAMPTIDPEPKTGKWIDKSGGIEGAWNYCSVCGEQAIDLYDFCPNCGADMRGERYGKAD